MTTQSDMAEIPMPKWRGEWEIRGVRPGARVKTKYGYIRRYQVWLRKSDGSSLRLFFKEGCSSEYGARVKALDTANTYSP